MAIIRFPDPYFKLQTRSLYLDVPNSIVENFLHEVSNITQNKRLSTSKMYDRVVALRDQFNDELGEEYGKWFRFVVKKGGFQKKPFAIQVRINWKAFVTFLDQYATRSDLSLEEKYEYISECRHFIGYMTSAPRDEHIARNTKAIAADEISAVKKHIREFLASLKSIRSKLRSRFLRKGWLPKITVFTSELESIIQGIGLSFDRGLIPTCYREMRTILENLSWVVFDDLLCYTSSAIRSNETFIPPYRVLSRRWFDWAKNPGFMVRGMGELGKSLNRTIGHFDILFESTEYDWGKKKIKDAFYRNLTYPLLMSLVGIKADVPTELIEWVPTYERRWLESVHQMDLAELLSDLKGNRLSESERMLARRMSRAMTKSLEPRFTMPYLSNEVVLQVTSKMLGLNLYDFYDKYSYFVHSYSMSWQIAPFSSILELKVFEQELSRFLQIIQSTLQEASQRL
ncbi:MAG: hypothetical protein KAR39_06795 [Thermoplasmata archaeon]|nr:hypothetical protein [Thermoplasmata archaeon]